MGKKLDDQLWYIILSCLEVHNNTGYTVDDFEFGTKTLDVFPSVPTEFQGNANYYHDEQANRFGIACSDITVRVREFFQVPDFEDEIEAREEFRLFRTVTDIFEYYKEKLLMYRTDLR